MRIRRLIKQPLISLFLINIRILLLLVVVLVVVVVVVVVSYLCHRMCHKHCPCHRERPWRGIYPLLFQYIDRQPSCDDRCFSSSSSSSYRSYCCISYLYCRTCHKHCPGLRDTPWSGRYPLMFQYIDRQPPCDDRCFSSSSSSSCRSYCCISYLYCRTCHKHCPGLRDTPWSGRYPLMFQYIDRQPPCDDRCFSSSSSSSCRSYCCISYLCQRTCHKHCPGHRDTPWSGRYPL